MRMEEREMSVEAVIFDLDGTLLNTLEDLTDAVNFALKNTTSQIGHWMRFANLW